MFILLMIHLCSACPIIYCSQDPSHLCAFFAENQITVAPCLGNDWCDIKKLHSFEQQSLSCQPRIAQSMPRSSIYELMQRVCAEKDYVNILDRLTDAKHPKICTTDNDCLLQSGMTSECKCGLSKLGNAYCTLGRNDIENQYKYEAACAGDIDSFLYYLYYTDLYVYLQDRTQCTDFVFEEITLWSYLYAGGSVAQVIAKDYIEYSSSAIIISSLMLIYTYQNPKSAQVYYKFQKYLCYLQNIVFPKTQNRLINKCMVQLLYIFKQIYTDYRVQRLLDANEARAQQSTLQTSSILADTIKSLIVTMPSRSTSIICYAAQSIYFFFFFYRSRRSPFPITSMITWGHSEFISHDQFAFRIPCTLQFLAISDIFNKTIEFLPIGAIKLIILVLTLLQIKREPKPLRSAYFSIAVFNIFPFDKSNIVVFSVTCRIRAKFPTFLDSQLISFFARIRQQNIAVFKLYQGFQLLPNRFFTKSQNAFLSIREHLQQFELKILNRIISPSLVIDEIISLSLFSTPISINKLKYFFEINSISDLQYTRDIQSINFC